MKKDIRFRLLFFVLSITTTLLAVFLSMNAIHLFAIHYGKWIVVARIIMYIWFFVLGVFFAIQSKTDLYYKNQNKKLIGKVFGIILFIITLGDFYVYYYSLHGIINNKLCIYLMLCSGYLLFSDNLTSKPLMFSILLIVCFSLFSILLNDIIDASKLNKYISEVFENFGIVMLGVILSIPDKFRIEFRSICILLLLLSLIAIFLPNVFYDNYYGKYTIRIIKIYLGYYSFLSVKSLIKKEFPHTIHLFPHN